MKARTVVSRFVRLVRRAWLVLGAALLTLLAAEALYRTQAAVRSSISGRHSVEEAYPEAGQAWFDSLVALQSVRDRLVWHPYVEYVESPMRSTYWNADSLGHRRTVQANAKGGPPRAAFLFGGSSMLGTYLRDSTTIPSRVASDLAALGIRDVVITNFGQTGYVFTQEALELLLQLRSGAKPALVVFFDGGNEVGSVVESRRAGLPRHEDERARDWDLGRQLFSWRSDLATEARVAFDLGRVAASRLQLPKKFARAPRPLASASSDALAEDLIRTYLGTVEWVEALAQHYGFVAFYCWEPLLGSAVKPLSTYEKRVTASFADQATGRMTLAVRALVPGRLAPRAEAAVPGRFADLSAVFAGDSETAFSNDAHTTERGTAVIANRLARLIAPFLERRLRASTAPTVSAAPAR